MRNLIIFISIIIVSQLSCTKDPTTDTCQHCPVINSFAPMVASAGETMTITGRNFSGVSKVVFSDHEALFIDEENFTDNEIQVQIPESESRTARIVVHREATLPNGEIVNVFSKEEIIFQYKGVVIEDFNPKEAKHGEIVTITGYGFGTDTSELSVSINDLELELNAIQNDKLELIIPKNCPDGPLKVVKDNNSHFSNSIFSYNPTIEVSTIFKTTNWDPSPRDMEFYEDRLYIFSREELRIVTLSANVEIVDLPRHYYAGGFVDGMYIHYFSNWNEDKDETEIHKFTYDPIDNNYDESNTFSNLSGQKTLNGFDIQQKYINNSELIFLSYAFYDHESNKSVSVFGRANLEFNLTISDTIYHRNILAGVLDFVFFENGNFVCASETNKIIFYNDQQIDSLIFDNFVLSIEGFYRNNEEYVFASIDDQILFLKGGREFYIGSIGGYQDGNEIDAKFRAPNHLVSTKEGIFVFDSGNNAIRKITIE